MPPPQVWRCLTHYLKLDEKLSRAWWQALGAAQWSTPVSWRQRLALFESRPEARLSLDQVMVFFQRQCSPVEVMNVLAALEGERRRPHGPRTSCLKIK
jgi:hypothetical protein